MNRVAGVSSSCVRDAAGILPVHDVEQGGRADPHTARAQLTKVNGVRK